MAEGGELEFVKRIIHDSLQLKKRLRWYSCMLGKKCSLAPLKEELRNQGVPKVTHTEFCQGRTMRWALAWSFYEDVIVPSPPSKRRKLDKVRKPLSFTLPEAGLKELQAKASALSGAARSPVDSVTALLEKTLTDLRVLHKPVPCSKQEHSLFLTAVENTWIHSRQKRRETLRQLRELPRAPHCAGTRSQTTVATAAPAKTPASQNQSASMQSSNNRDDGAQSKATSAQEIAGQQQPAEQIDNMASSIDASEEATHNQSEELKEVSENVSGEDKVMETSVSTAAGQEPGLKEAAATAKRPLSPGAGEHFLFKCLLNVMPEESDVVIEMHWVNGQNKDLMNQLCTYLKNTLLKSVAKS